MGTRAWQLCSFMQKFSISTCSPNSESHSLLSQKGPGVDLDVSQLLMGKPGLTTCPVLTNMVYRCLGGRGRYAHNLVKPTVTTEKSTLLVINLSMSEENHHNININPKSKGLVFFQGCLSPWSWWIPILVSQSNLFIIQQLLCSLSLSFFKKCIFTETSRLSKPENAVEKNNES